MNSLTLDIIFEVENMECALMKFTEKVCLIIKSGFWKSVSHHKIWFLANCYQMQLISCPNNAFFTDLTFDLYLKMYFLTSDLNFTEQRNEALCMKFIYHEVYFIVNSWFLTKLIQMQLVYGTCKAFSCILIVDLDL